MTTGIKVRHECGNKGYIIPKITNINIEKGEDDDSNHKEKNKVHKKSVWANWKNNQFVQFVLDMDNEASGDDDHAFSQICIL